MQMKPVLTRRQLLKIAAGLGALAASSSLLSACDPASLLSTGKPQARFFVALNGDDNWTGKLAEPNANSSDGPFATLERARDAIRQLKADKELPAGGVSVEVRAGTYWRASTFALQEEDSGTTEAPIIYRAYQNEAVRISGGSEVHGFTAVTDAAIRDRLDPAARDHVVQCDLKAQGISDFGRMKTRGFAKFIETSGLEVFVDDVPMQLARYPNEGWERIAGAPLGQEGKGFSYAGERPQRWAASEDIWVYGYWTYDWADSYERVASIDTASKTIRTFAVGPYGYTPGNRFYFLNVLEELDAPGEWYLDRATGIVYLWSPEPLEIARVTVSMLSQPLVTLEGVSHVTLQNITFECARGSGIVITGGEGNLIAGCVLRNLGTFAISIGKGAEEYANRIYENSMWDRQGGTNHGIVGCDIYNTGEGGILLGGGNRRALTPAGNYALNNHLWNSNRIARTYRPAIAIDGVGNRIANNLIHDLPHFGIWLHGNEHLIENNEIHHVCMETNDAGAFYMGRDYTERGNVIRHNYFHDLGDGDLVQSVYLDDCASGTLMFGNIIYKGGRGVMIGGGRDNTIENNIFIEGRPAVHVDARGLGWMAYYFTNREPILFNRLRATHPDKPPYSERYPMLASLKADEQTAFPKGNRVLRNIRVGGRWLDLLDGLELKHLELLDNFTDGDPGFVDLGKQDFHLRDDSPVLKLGFKPIPIEKIGLYRDEYRPTLPA